MRTAAADAPVNETRYASMRYVGQGYEIDVQLPETDLDESGAEQLREAFEAEYRRLYTRTVPDVPIEIVTWRIRVSTITRSIDAPKNPVPLSIQPKTSHRVFDNSECKWLNYGIYNRAEIDPGHTFSGPALVIEDQTTTVVNADFDCLVNAVGHLLLTRRGIDKPEKGGADQ